MSLATGAAVTAGLSYAGGKIGEGVANMNTKAEQIGIDIEEYVPEGRTGGAESWYWGKEGVDVLENSVETMNEEIDKAAEDLNDRILQGAATSFGTQLIAGGIADIADINVADADWVADEATGAYSLPSTYDAAVDGQMGWFKKLFTPDLVDKAAATQGIDKYVAGGNLNPQYIDFTKSLNLGNTWKSDLLTGASTAYQMNKQ